MSTGRKLQAGWPPLNEPAPELGSREGQRPRPRTPGPEEPRYPVQRPAVARSGGTADGWFCSQSGLGVGLWRSWWGRGTTAGPSRPPPQGSPAWTKVGAHQPRPAEQQPTATRGSEERVMGKVQENLLFGRAPRGTGVGAAGKGCPRGSVWGPSVRREAAVGFYFLISCDHEVSRRKC